VAATVHRILGKILHRPTVRAREFSSSPGGQLYLDALQELFDLAVAEART
jgi:glutamyl-tRNA reductase